MSENLTWSRDGEWGVRGVDLAAVPPHVYAALFRLYELESGLAGKVGQPLLEKRPLKVYLAGKITGDPNYRANFAAYEALAADKGYIPLNPAVLPRGLTEAEYMRICLAMVDCADLVWLLPGWEDSEGACLERAYCDKVCKPWETMGGGVTDEPF